MLGNQGAENNSVIRTWDPSSLLRRIDVTEAKYSKGFLRSRPERWFPGFAAQWLPVMHSLGIEARVLDIKPVINPPKISSHCFVGSIDDELLGIVFDDQSVPLIIDAVSPSAVLSAENLVLEYMARRLLSSLAISWTGPAGSVVKFDRDRKLTDIQAVGAVKLIVELGSGPITVWFLLGRSLVERLDGLWRRQLKTGNKSSEYGSELTLEIAQLAVAPSMLADYIRSGAVVDLEIPVSDQVVFRSAERAIAPAKLVLLGNNFGAEILNIPTPAFAVPDGTTRLSVEIARVKVNELIAGEISQAGSVIDTQVPISSKVFLVVSGERVKEANLCTFEGRFALSVL